MVRVYEVDGCGTLLGFLVYDAALFHVVGHVGNVYAYFPKSPFQFADGEGVVEVLGILGVDGEGGHTPEVLTSGYFLGGDFGGYLVGSFLYGSGVDIGQAEFRRMACISVVLSPARPRMSITWPMGFLLCRAIPPPLRCFVARLAAFQLFFGDEDVVGKRTVFRYKESV